MNQSSQKNTPEIEKAITTLDTPTLDTLALIDTL
jgi:hypothetical protein